METPFRFQTTVNEMKFCLRLVVVKAVLQSWVFPHAWYYLALVELIIETEGFTPYASTGLVLFPVLDPPEPHQLRPPVLADIDLVDLDVIPRRFNH